MDRNTPERMTPEAALDVLRHSVRRDADPQRVLLAVDTLAALAQRVEEMEAERRVWLDANELLVKWKGTIDEARIVRRLPFPPDYDRSPAYAIASLLTHEREAAEARADALEKEAGRLREFVRRCSYAHLFPVDGLKLSSEAKAALSEPSDDTPTPSEADDHGRR